MKRTTELYDFKAFGAAIIAARKAIGENTYGGLPDERHTEATEKGYCC